MQRHHLNLTAGLLVAAMTMPAMAANINWQSDGSGTNPDQYQGKWENTDHWSTGSVPGADDNARWNDTWSSNGPAITTIDGDTLTALNVSAINVRSLEGSTAYTQSSRRSRLIVNGTELAPITLNVGSTTDAPGDAIYSDSNFSLTFNWANLNIIGTPSGDGIYLRRQPGGGAFHTFTDTNVTMTAAAAGKGMTIGIGNANGALLGMTRGSLTITNNTGDARIYLAGTNSTTNTSGLTLSDTVLSTNNMLVENSASFIFNGENAATASSITGTLNLNKQGSAFFNGGEINIGGVVFDSNGNVDEPMRLDVDGANVNVLGNLRMNSTYSNSNSTNSPNAKLAVNVHSGALHVTNNIFIGGVWANKNYELNVSGGELTVDGSVQLGQSSVSNRHGDGVMNVTGGTTIIQNHLNVGANTEGGGFSPSNAASDGYYHQTGGNVTIGGEVQLRPLSTTGRGTEQFVVGSGATMTLAGAGFVQYGTTDWSNSLLTAANLSFAGTLKFSPDGVSEQNLIVFGSDIGDDTAGYDADFAIGTLDVSDLIAAGALLNVLAAGNETTNAAYVHALLLGDIGLADPGSFFAGDANIYYDPSVSDIAGTYAFGSGGGSLIAIPEPASALLFMGGALAMLRRRKVQA